MALIVEDGSGTNPAANSYATTEQLLTYANERGVDLGSLPGPQLEVLMVKAMDYLESLGHKYKGQKVSTTQPLQWPRVDVWDVEIPGAMLPFDEIPRLIEYAQLALAIEAHTLELMPNRNLTGQGAVIKEKVGDIELTYAQETPTQNFTSAFSKPYALLSPLFNKNGLSLVKV